MFLNWLSSLFSTSSSTATIDKKQLSLYLYTLIEHNVIDYDQYSMIEGVLQFSNLRVRDVMVSRSQMVVLNSQSIISSCVPDIVSSQHSRFPVIDGDLDQVRGLVLAKDLLSFIHAQDSKDAKIVDVVRPAIFVPESKRLDALLREFQSTHNHMAIVIDEYGGVSGLITIEDVIEQITGDIEDEHDHIPSKNFIHPLSDTTFLVDALTPLELFNNRFHTNISDEYFDTIGGIIAQKFGCVPKIGAICQHNHLTFKVVHANLRQIKSLEVTIARKHP